jgi:hypothetical protein
METTRAFRTPDWVTQHGGRLARSEAAGNWLVFFNNEPQYRLDPQPAGGRFGCEIVQTNNGRHVGSGSVCPSEDEAIQSGLEILRKILGW